MPPRSLLAVPLRLSGERGFRTLCAEPLCQAQLPGVATSAGACPPGGLAEARAPVRVDLAGGWTDTPPQACELGGTVLNVALLLNRQRPMIARVERLREPVLELAAEDPGRSRYAPAEFFNRSPSGSPLPVRNPPGRAPLCRPFRSCSRCERLRRLGGGIRHHLRRGSERERSRHLEHRAALLAALSSAFGQERSLDELCLDVLRLEQMMGTGGGWQDQVGGMWGGVKFATSAPRIEQRPEVELAVPRPRWKAAFADRLVLFYTGEPRLAKDMLQRVVGRYLVGTGQRWAR